MDKQAQDKLWNDLSEETQQEYREKYKFHLADSKRDPKDNFGGGYDLTVLRSETIVKELESMFGTHNLNPNPNQIKTWEDVEKAEGGDIIVDSKVINPNGRAWGLGLKYHQKAEATLKLAILIDLGYGGMVSEEEMKDTSIDIYNIYPDEKKQFIIGCLNTRLYDFICFHTRQQAEEFWSYESNRKLVEQYFMM